MKRKLPKIPSLVPKTKLGVAVYGLLTAIAAVYFYSQYPPFP